MLRQVRFSKVREEVQGTTSLQWIFKLILSCRQRLNSSSWLLWFFSFFKDWLTYRWLTRLWFLFCQKKNCFQRAGSFEEFLPPDRSNSEWSGDGKETTTPLTSTHFHSQVGHFSCHPKMGFKNKDWWRQRSMCFHFLFQISWGWFFPQALLTTHQGFRLWKTTHECT